jgi:hypothetical protein
MNDLWRDSGYVDASKFYKWLHQNHHNQYTFDQVDKFLKKQKAWQLTAQYGLPSQWSSWWKSYPGQMYQIDTMVYNRWRLWDIGTKSYIQYVICMIDVYSRYANARALNSKEMPVYLNAIKEMCEENAAVIEGGDGWPKEVSSDNEFNKGEYQNYPPHPTVLDYERAGDFIRYMRAHGCHKFFFSDVGELHKNPIVERFHRTLALRLNRKRQQTHNLNWVGYLADIVKGYNHTYHSTIKAIPADVFAGRDLNYQLYKEVPRTFQVGDRVRYREEKQVFGRGDRRTYSKKVYVITAIIQQRYQLTDPQTQDVERKRFKEAELIHADETEDDFQENPHEIPEPEHFPRQDVEVENILPPPRRPQRERRVNQFLEGYAHNVREAEEEHKTTRSGRTVKPRQIYEGS